MSPATPRPTATTSPLSSVSRIANAAGVSEVLVPDLLHPVPIARVDRVQTRLSLSLAFATGIPQDLFAEALERASVAPSSWTPDSFSRALFLPTFVSLCFRVRAGGEESKVVVGHLLKVLASPPSDPDVVHHRRAIAAELAESSGLRSALEALYLSLSRLRGLLEGATGAGKWDPNRRQLDILAALKEVIDRMASDFGGARSGLSRLAGFAERVQASEPYQSLSDLLRYDERLATVRIDVAVGADGRVRRLDVLSVREDDANPFVSSPWRRWLAKLELVFRGFQFGDHEIMARLIDAVFEGVADELVALVQLTGDLELFLGALGFRDLARKKGLEVCLPELVGQPEPRLLHGLFNPLLLGLGVVPVPCDLETDRHDTTVLVTGPNSGGKTRLLESVGLAQVLAHAGLWVPAREAEMALANGLVVSLIEETKVDQTEGRLGTELKRIRSLFEDLAPGAMVILDELCSGTNPSEGEEIFELVVRMLGRLGPQAFVTTHFLQFAARLEREREVPGLRFLQAELGADQRATYQFIPGVATTSLAGHAAERLGVTGEQLLALVERSLARNSRT